MEQITQKDFYFSMLFQAYLKLSISKNNHLNVSDLIDDAGRFANKNLDAFVQSWVDAGFGEAK